MGLLTMQQVATAVALLLAAWLLRALHTALAAKRGLMEATAAAAAQGRPPPLLPPTVPGLPLLGSALALGSGGAAFLHRCHKQHGDAFTLCLLGQRMTFVLAPAALPRYFTAPDSLLTFAPAVQQALRHQLVPSALPQHGVRLLDLLLARLRRWPASGQLELWAEAKGLLFEASVGALFGPRFLGQPEGQPVAGSAGGGAVPARSPRARRLQDAFFAFEAGFELAASPVPHLLQPRFLVARRTLLRALRESYRAGHFKGTVAGSLIESCGLPSSCVSNMLLAVLWASQANAVPTLFWLLGFLLLPDNRRHLEAVLAEVQAAAAAAAAGAAGTPAAAAKARAQARAAAAAQQQQQLAGGEPAEAVLLTDAQRRGLVALACDRRSHLAAAVSETLRLRSFSIDVRIAASDGELPGGVDGSGPGIWVQKGDVVAISPYESHLDPRLYGGPPGPDVFDPSREGMRLGGSTAPHVSVVGVGGLPGLSFGGGKCPGRYFAEAELALAAATLLLLFDLRLLLREAADPAGADAGAAAGAAGGGRAAAAAAGGGVGTAPGDPAGLLPPPDLTRLVGVKVPAGACWVQYQRRRP